MDNPTVKQDKFPVKIFVCILVLGFFGLSLLTNMQGLFYVTVSEHFGVARSQFSLYYTVQSLAAMVTLFFAGNIMTKHQNKLSLIVAAAVITQFVGYFLFAKAQSIVLFFVVAVFLGIAGGFDTHLLIGVLTNNWFAKKNGFVLGLSTALASVAGAIISPKMSVIIASNWRTGYLVIAFGVLITLLPVSFIIKFSPAQEGRRPYGAAELEAEADKNTNLDTSGVPYKTALKSPAFYLCALLLFFATGWSCFTFAMPGYISSLGYDASVVGFCASAYLIGGVIGKFLGGTLNDALGFLKSMIVLTVIGVAGMILLIFAAPNSSTMVIIGGVLFGVGMGICGVHPPLIVRACFGNKDYSRIYSNVGSLIWVASMVLIPIYNLIFDSTGSYVPAMWAAIVMIVLALVCGSTAVASSKKLKRE